MVPTSQFELTDRLNKKAIALSGGGDRVGCKEYEYSIPNHGHTLTFLHATDRFRDAIALLRHICRATISGKDRSCGL